MEKDFDKEEQLISAGRGKWSERGVPHRNWTCVDIEDLGQPQMICEMCESQTIRYVHHMTHDDYEDDLAVGCICAGHMEGDVAAARLRETSMRSRAAKRKRWVGRSWKISKKGNSWIESDGFRTTVYPKGQRWAATICRLDSTGLEHSRRDYPTMDEAKLAAFDYITRLLAK